MAGEAMAFEGLQAAGTLARRGEPAELLRRIAAGERSAMADFYSLFQERTYRLAMAQVADPRIAGDVLVDTMFEIWEDAGRLPRGMPAAEWALGIALRRSRPQRPPRTRADRGAGAARPPSVRRLSAVTAAMGNIESVHAALGRLRPGPRTVLHLAAYEGLDAPSIARLFGRSDSVAAAWLEQARWRLQHQLGEMLADGPRPEACRAAHATPEIARLEAAFDLGLRLALHRPPDFAPADFGLDRLLDRIRDRVWSASTVRRLLRVLRPVWIWLEP